MSEHTQLMKARSEPRLKIEIHKYRDRTRNSADPQLKNKAIIKMGSPANFEKDIPMTRRMNKNALKHGAFAKEIVIPGESAEEFEQLLQEFHLQFNPIGAPQEAVVRELAGIQWLKDRLNRPLRQSFIHSELIVSEVGTWPLDLIVNCAKKSMEVLDSTKEMAMARADQLVQAKFALLKGTTSEEREKVLNAAAQLAANSGEWGFVAKAMIDAANNLQNTARDPLSQNVDVVLKLFEQLDRRYDKAVKRLVNLKEYDGLYGAKLIEQLPQAEPTPIAPDETGDRKEFAKLNKGNGEAVDSASRRLSIILAAKGRFGTRGSLGPAIRLASTNIADILRVCCYALFDDCSNELRSRRNRDNLLSRSLTSSVIWDAPPVRRVLFGHASSAGRRAS